ncbi:MAG: ABC transporter permease [Actinobacteria bacterium]|nr:ABC transporter permease [Actinomycetota bacterium]
MLQQAWSEVRHHPSRFISTIVAVAISVAFLAGSAVFVATEGRAQGRALNVAISAADLVVTAGDDAPATTVRETLAGVPGVAAVSPVLSLPQLVTTDTGSELLALVNVPAEPLRWATLKVGRWPDAANEVVLSTGAASSLGVSAGGSLRLSGTDRTLVVVGVTDEPSTVFAKTGYAADAAFAAAGIDPATGGSQWSVKVAGTDPAAALPAVKAAMAAISPKLSVELAATVQDKAVADVARGFDVLTNVLWAFAAVALVVGMITISNTFTITLAQRRRQTGLLRAVGASGGQVRRRFLAEALILGVVGSALGLGAGVGIAALAATWSGSVFWGLALPTVQLLMAFGLGVLTTVVAAWVPIVRGTRVAPLEALQPVLTTEQARRASAGRAITCGVLLLGGAGLAVAAVVPATSVGFLLAIGAGLLISLAVLFGAPLFVPGLLRLFGRPVRRLGTVPRLAADNAERNPRRATATATALMLAIGLVVTLQVAAASIRETTLNQIQERYPVDVAVTWPGSDGNAAAVPSDVRDRLGATQGVSASVSLDGGLAEVNGDGVTLLGWKGPIARVTGQGNGVADDQVLVNPDASEGWPATVSVSGSQGRLTLKVVPSHLVDYGQAMVSEKNLARITTVTPDSMVWLSVRDRSQAVSVIAAVSTIVGSQGQVSGGLPMAATYQQILNVVLTITTALLAVAVVIALIGVSNTLGLSVLERTRESALLRALGLQSRSLRWMLTVEALLVTLVGVVVGVAAGAFFGWLAVTSLARSAHFDNAVFTVEVPQTLGMVAIAVVAAALASVLPGRRAAKAAPTEALADI